MSLHVHRLAGCAPAPLAHYLKALGLLRLIGEQADPGVRGWWDGDAFALLTHLDAAALRRFLLHEYAPTPLLAPWNGGSGFYPKDNTSGFSPVRSAEHPRFSRYSEAISTAAKQVGGRDERPEKADKAELLERCRATWGAGALDWLNAAVVVGDDDPAYPALLGTGGNDGRLDFTNNFMQRLVELFDPTTGAPAEGADALLDDALFGLPCEGLGSSSVGQFLPGGAGGANAGFGFQGSSLVNPWDFVLMLEGAVCMQVAAVRRLESAELAQAAAPFAVRGNAAGYGSAARSEESARGEQWMPLWGAPASWDEVRGLLREGRMQSGRQPAKRALDAARAVALHGVARGVVAFQRYGFIERNGQSNLAVPLGRWEVRPRPETRILDEIDGWVRGLRRASRDPQRDPESLRRSVRRIEGAMMALYREGGRAIRWQELLLALAEAEDGLVRRPKHTANQGLSPLPLLDPGWVEQAYDDSTELRLAASIASQVGSFGRRPDPIRHHCLPLEGHRFATTASGLKQDPRVVWRGRDLVSDLAAVVGRRLVEGRRDDLVGLPLQSRVSARLSDVHRFLLGQVDERRLAGLARALMAVRWSSADDALRDRLSRDADEGRPSVLPAYALLRVVHAPRKVRDLTPVRDQRCVRLLTAGHLDAAVRVAAARLTAGGLRPRVRMASDDPELARRIAASLAIPIAHWDLERRLLSVAGRIPDSSRAASSAAPSLDTESHTIDRSS